MMVEPQEGCALLIPGVGVSTRFRAEVEELSGQKIMACYQCGECTAGCPMAFAMDVMPNRVMRMVQLGLSKPVLESASIWLCAGCETCSTRCPRGVELSRVMDTLRQIAISSGVQTKESEIVKFHRTFLGEIRRHGRVHEVGMLARYKLATGKFFTDMILGARMFARGKLALMPSRVKGTEEIQQIFRELGDADHSISGKQSSSYLASDDRMSSPAPADETCDLCKSQRSGEDER